MKINAHQLKVLSKKYALDYNISAHEVLQNYMLERVLFRLSISKYSTQFILKGGLFITSLIGLGDRSTMDLDANVRGIDLEPQNISDILFEILNLDAHDGIYFKLISVENIRVNEEYEGIRFKIMATLENIEVHLRLDLSSGDIITPNALSYEYPMIFNHSSIQILTYSIETVLAEKLHAILELNGSKGRMKDYYDIYYFVSMRSSSINYETLRLAIKNTFYARKSLDILDKANEILEQISRSLILSKKWNEYSQKHSYTKHITFRSTIDSISKLLSRIQ